MMIWKRKSKDKTPSLLYSLLPLVVTGLALGWSVFVFDVEPHVALLLGTITAGLVAYMHGYTWMEIKKGFIDSIHRVIPAIIILLIIGMMIGVWIGSGIVPALIYYGFNIMHPLWFLPIVLLLCSFVSIVTGSSWTTIGTIGLASVGIGHGLGLPAPVVVGAIVSGAFFGDKLSPLSDSTNLVPGVLGIDIYKHIKHMLYSVIPVFIIALVFYAVLNFRLIGADYVAIDPQKYQNFILEHFKLSPWLIIPPVFIIVAIALKVPAIPSLMMGVLLGGLMQLLVQGQGLGVVFHTINDGFSISSGWEEMDQVLSSGGMSSMYSVIFLAIISLALGGIMLKCKMLEVIVKSISFLTKRVGNLVMTTLSSSVIINIFGANQYLAVILPAQMFENEYVAHKLDLKNLSRALEAGGTLTAPLIPWNTSGIFVLTTLGVNAVAYTPYAVICWLTMIVVGIFGYFNITMTKKAPVAIRKEQEDECLT
jgi:Na+:H+ antiporter, NhaC family